MVLIVLGTWNMPFPRPLIEIEKLCEQKKVTEEIIVQTGHTQFDSRHMTMVPFFEQFDLEELYKKAQFVICQAGIGSIMMGLKNKKKIIAIPRLEKYNEHIDNHQLEILNVFEKQNHLMGWDENENLLNIILKLDAFLPKEYSFKEEKISDEIIQFISNSVTPDR